MIFIKLYGGFNIKGLELLGCGTQGKVYRIDSENASRFLKRAKLGAVS